MITWSSRFASLVKIVPAMVLIIIVLGSIYTGLATATEAAAIGAIGAALIVGLIDRALTWTNIKKILVETTKISGSLLIIVGAAFAFTQLLVVVRAPEAITGAVSSLNLPSVLIAIIVLLIIAMLGCLVDAASLLLVVTPIVLPIFTTLGYDPIWVGVILVVTLETAVITPPVGLNLYTMKSVVPELDIGDIIKGAVPYLFIEFALIVLLICVPAIVTWFPSISAA